MISNETVSLLWIYSDIYNYDEYYCYSLCCILLKLLTPKLVLILLLYVKLCYLQCQSNWIIANISMQLLPSLGFIVDLAFPTTPHVLAGALGNQDFHTLPFFFFIESFHKCYTKCSLVYQWWTLSLLLIAM